MRGRGVKGEGGEEGRVRETRGEARGEGIDGRGEGVGIRDKRGERDVEGLSSFWRFSIKGYGLSISLVGLFSLLLSAF